MIYLDNAATTLKKPPGTAQAMVSALSSQGNPGRGVNDASLDASRSVFATRELLADFLGAGHPHQIAFTANSTEALNIAIKGFLRPGDHVITTQAEHNSVLRPLYQMKRTGIQVTIIRCDRKGRLDYEALKAAFTRKTRAVVCTQASNVTGNVFDIRRIAEMAHQRGSILIADGSQTAGTLPVNIEKDGIDIFCFTGHKGLMGPQGTGGLYVRDGIFLDPLLSGGTGVHSFDPDQPPEMPAHLEAGTLNGPGLAGLHASVSFLKETGIESVCQKERTLLSRFMHAVAGIPGVVLYGDTEARIRAPVQSLNIEGLDAEQISDVLSRTFGIATRAGAHCAPLMHKALGTDHRGTVRFSFSYYTTEEEIDAAADALRQIAAAARSRKD